MATVEKIIVYTRLKNTILGQLKIGEHQAICGARSSFIHFGAKSWIGARISGLAFLSAYDARLKKLPDGAYTLRDGVKTRFFDTTAGGGVGPITWQL